MCPESYDIWIISTGSAHRIVADIHSSIRDLWPNICGYIELQGEDDLSFGPGEFPSGPLPANCMGAYFSRDRRMFDEWGWGVFTSEHFEGEGPVSLYAPSTDESPLRISLNLPDDPNDNAFSRRILDRLIRCIPNYKILNE